MSRRSIIIILLVCIAVSFSGCVSDWLYELPNDYCILNNATYNSLNKITNRDKGSCNTQVVVESYVHEFSYNEQYVAVKWFEPSTMDFENFDLNDFSFPSYYVVDTVSTNIHGPYENEAAFETACEELNVGELSEWICTKSNPNKLTN